MRTQTLTALARGFGAAAVVAAMFVAGYAAPPIFKFTLAQPEPRCGDSVLDVGEHCDDGNTVAGDGCSAACFLEFCGDGVIESALGEECDEGEVDQGGNAVPWWLCDGTDCRWLPLCGNGEVEPEAKEECDDGGRCVGEEREDTTVLSPDDAQRCLRGGGQVLPAGGDGCDALCQEEQEGALGQVPGDESVPDESAASAGDDSGASGGAAAESGDTPYTVEDAERASRAAEDLQRRIEAIPLDRALIGDLEQLSAEGVQRSRMEAAAGSILRLIELLVQAETPEDLRHVEQEAATIEKENPRSAQLSGVSSETLKDEALVLLRSLLKSVRCQEEGGGDERCVGPLPVCSDRLDNDGDGLVDHPEDDGCDSLLDTDEAGGGAPAAVEQSSAPPSPGEDLSLSDRRSSLLSARVRSWSPFPRAQAAVPPDGPPVVSDAAEDPEESGGSVGQVTPDPLSDLSAAVKPEDILVALLTIIARTDIGWETGAETMALAEALLPYTDDLARWGGMPREEVQRVLQERGEDVAAVRQILFRAGLRPGGPSAAELTAEVGAKRHALLVRYGQIGTALGLHGTADIAPSEIPLGEVLEGEGELPFDPEQAMQELLAVPPSHLFMEEGVETLRSLFLSLSVGIGDVESLEERERLEVELLTLRSSMGDVHTETEMRAWTDRAQRLLDLLVASLEHQRDAGVQASVLRRSARLLQVFVSSWRVPLFLFATSTCVLLAFLLLRLQRLGRRTVARRRVVPPPPLAGPPLSLHGTPA